MTNNFRITIKHMLYNEMILIPLIFILFFIIKFSEAKNKNREEIYLYNIGDSKYVQYDKKKHKFILSHLGTPFNLISDKWGNITLTYEGKFLHSKVFDRNLTTSTRSIFHGLNQTFTLSYSGNSMYKLRIKHYCVSSYNKTLYEDTCKEFSSGKNQYFYIVPKPFYQKHINLQNNMFRGYNNDIGQCMQMAALRAGQSMMGGMGMNNNCSDFNSGNIGNYISQSGEDMYGSYVNTTGSPGYNKNLAMYSDSENYTYKQSDSNISIKQFKEIKNSLNKICSKVNNRNKNFDSSSSTSNYLNKRGKKNFRKRSTRLKGGSGDYGDIMRGIAKLQQVMSMNSSNCFDGGGNPFNRGFNRGNLNQQCIPIYNNDMYMKGNFNNQYQNRNNSYIQPFPNMTPMNGNVNLSSSLSGIPNSLLFNQPGIPNNYPGTNTGMSNFSNSLNQSMIPMGGVPPQIPNILSQQSSYSNPNMQSNCVNPTGSSGNTFSPSLMGTGNFNNSTNIYGGNEFGPNMCNGSSLNISNPMNGNMFNSNMGNFPPANNSSVGSFNSNFNKCNDSNISGPLNLLADPSCMGVLNNNNTYQNTTPTSNIPGSLYPSSISTMTPMYGANLYPTGQIQMNSPSTMLLGNTSVGYTNVC